MITVNATSAKQNFGDCLMRVSGGPVLIERSGKPTAVLISIAEYERFIELENSILLHKAEKAIQNGFLGENEISDWFNKMNTRFSNIIVKS